MAGRVLVVDDDAAVRIVVAEALRQEGHDVAVASTFTEGAAALERFRPELLITDVVLPDGDGLARLPELLDRHPGLPVIVLSAQNTLTTAIRATEQGAFDYLPKPFDIDELARAVAQGLARSRRQDAMPDADGPGEALPLIGRSPPMQAIYKTIARVIGNDLTVLILGESGTGKELVARAIHDLGPRRGKPFVAINMAAIPRELIEAELFGHERGAFTGATSRNAGRFEQARGGTLFLDEIGDMPTEAQTRLLRVLQSGEYSSVGGNRTARADVRIVAATHKDLEKLIAQQAFREDLYYRLNVVPITLPALRERPEDIAELARHFLDTAARDGLSRKTLSAEAVQRLIAYHWPGNVRELENLMRRLAALGRDEIITDRDIDSQLGGGGNAALRAGEAGSLAESVETQLARLFAAHDPALPPDGLYARLLADLEQPMLRLTLAAVKGNQLRAAQLLGINRNTLRKKLAEYSIDAQRIRAR